MNLGDVSVIIKDNSNLIRQALLDWIFLPIFRYVLVDHEILYPIESTTNDRIKLRNNLFLENLDKNKTPNAR